MNTNQPLRFTQISAFNPGRLTDDEIERTFIARVKLFEHLFEQLIAEKPGSIPQHLLIIGERGMGKSTLLHRIAVELRKAPHRERFIPLTFPEEQYNVDRLSKFWLNCLDALADALDRAGHPDLDALDADIDRWNREARQTSAMQMYGHFKSWLQRLPQRPVLLVDNLNLIFGKINKEEQHQLRAILMENGAPVLVGASAHSMEEVVDYGAPFYDYFKQHTLKKLSFEEAIETLRNLGTLTGNKAFIDEIYNRQPRLRALYQLTGGTPRTLTMLYPLVQNGFSASIQTDLEALMDTATALYKARFEELPGQMQVILDAVALHWDPVGLETLRELTQLENAQLSPQLKRLYDTGWLHRTDAYATKGYAYEISERFFNIWYLMRRSSRRQKRELLCLTKFLGVFYGEELPLAAKTMLRQGMQHPDHAGLRLAMADAVNDKRLAKKLREKTYRTLAEWATTDGDILKNFEIPAEFIDKKEQECFKKAEEFYRKGEYENSVEQLNRVVKLNSKSKAALFLLGDFYQYHLGRYTDSETAYKKAIELDEKSADLWLGLGNLYQYYLGRYLDSETAYRKAIELDEKLASVWHNLGNLYQSRLERYSDSEMAYRKAIDLDEKFAFPWKGLGNLYHYSLGRYKDSESAYQKAIELDEKYISPWNDLGNLYQDFLCHYPESENAYLHALNLELVESGHDFIRSMVKHNLIFLYRDRLKRFSEAKALFETLEPEDGWLDIYCLHATLFALYDNDPSAARENLQKALSNTGGNLSPFTIEDWHRFAAVAQRLGYGKMVLETFEATGNDVQLRPFYEAIKALGEADNAAYLNSVAAEVREPAGLILEHIRRRM